MEGFSLNLSCEHAIAVVHMSNIINVFQCVQVDLAQKRISEGYPVYLNAILLKMNSVNMEYVMEKSVRYNAFAEI